MPNKKLRKSTRHRKHTSPASVGSSSDTDVSEPSTPPPTRQQAHITPALTSRLPSKAPAATTHTNISKKKKTLSLKNPSALEERWRALLCG